MIEAQLQKAEATKESGENKSEANEHENEIKIKSRPDSVRPSEGDPDEHTDGPASPGPKKEKRAFLRRGSSNKYNPNPSALKK